MKAAFIKLNKIWEKNFRVIKKLNEKVMGIDVMRLKENWVIEIDVMKLKENKVTEYV